MASSDSEGFESADEGHNEVEKASRKHRKSSSNYSDNALETAPDGSKPTKELPKDIKQVEGLQKDIKEVASGWDDFDIDVPEPVPEDGKKSLPVETKGNDTPKEKDIEKSQGWDDFDDWGDDGGTEEMTATALSSQLANASISGPVPAPKSTEPQNTKESGPSGPAAASPAPASSGWGWGWGVDGLISSATAGITSLTAQVSQGLTTVIESGIGAPDPEELARRPAAPTEPVKESIEKEHDDKPDDDGFPFGSILKLVGSTGSKVVSGGLDTLETLGRKTMDILQDGDPGLAKKRALIGLEERPVLSAVLREAAARAEGPAGAAGQPVPAPPRVCYENIFDDFGGLMHLEALEMVSRELGLRIEQRIAAAEPAARVGLRETLHQVEELCEMADDGDDEETLDGPTLHEALLKATEDLGVKLQFQPLVKQYEGVTTYLIDDNLAPTEVYKYAITSLAEATALALELYHKAAEMLLVKARRSTADEADSLTQMTVVLTKHLNYLALLFTEKLNAIHNKNDKRGEQNTVEQMNEKSEPKSVRNVETETVDVNGYVTNVFLEAENSCKYLHNALRLELPVLQIGAV